MKIFRNSIAIAILTTLMLALFAVFAGGMTSAGAAEVKTADVKYSAVPAGEYHLDTAHSIIGFAVRHLEINWVEGRFKDFNGTINYDDKDVTRSKVSIPALNSETRTCGQRIFLMPQNILK
jgi:polyisoprenoid-binding protein YceI